MLRRVPGRGVAVDRRWYEQVREIERDHWWFAGRRRVLGAVLERLQVRAGCVLDVGCGAGTNLDLLGQRFPAARLHGVDIDLGSLRHCRRHRPAAALVQADMARLPFRSASFDLVCALDALEHVADDAGALAGLHRVCRPGGTLLATVPAFPFLWGNVDRVGHHFRRYRQRELVRLVEKAGFATRFVRYFNTLLFPAIAGVRLLARLRGPGGGSDELGTDFDLVKSGPLNTALARVFGSEASWPAWTPPFGVSLLCVARRP
jgi:SAM-dependent methyltransferase